MANAIEKAFAPKSLTSHAIFQCCTVLDIVNVVRSGHCLLARAASTYLQTTGHIVNFRFKDVLAGGTDVSLRSAMIIWNKFLDMRHGIHLPVKIIVDSICPPNLTIGCVATSAETRKECSRFVRRLERCEHVQVYELDNLTVLVLSLSTWNAYDDHLLIARGVLSRHSRHLRRLGSYTDLFLFKAGDTFTRLESVGITCRRPPEFEFNEVGFLMYLFDRLCQLVDTAPNLHTVDIYCAAQKPAVVYVSTMRRQEYSDFKIEVCESSNIALKCRFKLIKK